MSEEILIVAGSRSWNTWLPSFISYKVHVLYEPMSFDEVLNCLRKFQCRKVLFLSHHSTLRRDFSWGTRLSGLVDLAVFQPGKVVELALDKAVMAQIDFPTGSLGSPIPELSRTEALALVREMPVVLKQREGTEGQGFQVHQRPDTLAVSLDQMPNALVQPFVVGRELSINLACFDSRCTSFPIVDKGMTNLSGIHPCLRRRFAPSQEVSPEVQDALRDTAAKLANKLDCQGVVEFEFIVTATQVFVLEINPRIAATMRMSSLACNQSILDCLLALISGKRQLDHLKPMRFSGELPVPSTIRNQMPTGSISKDVWVTTRITVVSDSPELLRRRLSVIEDCLSRIEQGKCDPSEFVAICRWQVAESLPTYE